MVDPAIPSVLELGYTQGMVDDAIQRVQREGKCRTGRSNIKKILNCASKCSELHNEEQLLLLINLQFRSSRAFMHF